MRLLPILLLSLTLPCAGALAQAPDTVKEGLWEIRVRSDIGGQPLTEAPMVINQCITQTTARDLMNQLNGTGGGCQVSNVTQNGQTAHWDMNCTGQIALSGTGQVTMSDAGFTGSMNFVVNMAGQSVPLNQNFEARWVGPCK
jgi:hypothetical protein